MKKSVIAVAVLLACASTYATNNNNGPQNSNVNQAIGTGGQGGAGGTGVGIGVGVGIGQGGNASATGGAVLGSGNSHVDSRNTNTNLNSVSNRNTNEQGQLQGQLQGQQQGQSQTARGGNSNQGQSQSTDNANNASQAVTVNGDTYQAQERNPVATAYAPNIAPTAVCMGSTSAGAQGVAVGVSFGTSWTDENCMLLEQVRSVAAVIGDKAAAAEMMCVVPAYREARARIGKACGTTPALSSTATHDVLHTPVTYTDPWIRRRLGLPPLVTQ